MTELPEWLATLVGRLTIENEMLRQALAAAQQAQTPSPAEDGPSA